jgi:hypothetical protein
MAATASLSFLPLSPSLFPGAGQPCRIAPGRAMGRPRQPGGPHVEGRCVRAGSDSTAGEVKDPTTLSTEHPRRTRAPASSATCPARRTARGTGGIYTSGCLLPRFKRTPGRRGTDAKPPTPPWGFPFATAPACAGLGEGGGASPPRRAGQGRSREPDRSRNNYAARSAVDPPRTSPSTAARGKERRPFASEKGAGPEQGPVHRRERLLRHATAVLDPATTTPPPQREHHRRRLLPFLPP